METTRNLHGVTANLFFAIALVMMVAALAFRNGQMVSLATFLIRILDVPFALVALLYGGSGLYLQINEGRETSSVWGILVVAVCILMFGLVVFVNFAFPSIL